MGDVSKATNRCSVCAQPSRLNCAKCKSPYCSVACQTDDWKNRGHKKACKRLVEAAAAKGGGGAARDEAPTPPPSPKKKAAPPVVDGPARGRADVARAKAAAAAVTATTAPAPEPDHWRGSTRCPVCLEDWDEDVPATIRVCCCRHICTRCEDTMGHRECPLCRTPCPKSAEEVLAMLRRHVENDNPAAVRQLGESYDLSCLLLP